jgi:RsiW-degrading membrane proteinase PrsW (M82 family)
MARGQGRGDGRRVVGYPPPSGRGAGEPDLTTTAASIPNPTSRPLVRRWLQFAVMVVGFGICAVVLAGAIGLEAGVQASLLGLVFAALPLGVVVPAFLWLDRFEAEPNSMLLFAFAWGALVASVGALVLNTSSLVLLQQSGQDPQTMRAVVVAPVIEESLKGAGVLILVLFRRREFDGVVDGIVYAGITAAGFAFAENILYLGRAYHESGGEGLALVFFLRGVMGPFAHPLFTVCTGIGLGVASSTRRPALRLIAPALGWLLAIALHGWWNLTTVAGLRGFLSTYVLLQVPVFVAFVSIALWARQREGRLIGAALTPYAVAGWLSYPEVAMLSSMPERRRARVFAKLAGGRSGLQAMLSFQDTASELALLRMRMARGTADAQATGTERVLLDALVRLRQVFVGTAGM